MVGKINKDGAATPPRKIFIYCIRAKEMEVNKNDKQFIKMIETPIPKLILKQSVPTIISMLITALYNMADAFFVSKINTSASGAVGVVFSVMAIIQAIGFTVGMGSGANISRLLGKKDKDKASEFASTATVIGLFSGILLTVAGSIFLSPIMRLLGATETALPYANEYAKYIFYGSPIMILSFILNNVLRAEGKASFAMIGITSGGILNIALDPLFIFTFGLGTAGAAIATLISQSIGVALLLTPFILKKTDVKLSPKSVKPFSKTTINIISNGFPSLCRQGLASISSILLNNAASVYGDPALSAFSIVGKIFMMLFSVILGFGQGYQPAAGYNYSSGNYKRVKKAAFFMLTVSHISVAVLGGVAALFAPEILKFFIDNDPEVVKIGAAALRYQCLALQFIPLGVLCNMTFQSLGKSVVASVLASFRQGLFFIPLILILPKYLKLLGVETAQPIADILNFFVAIPFFIWFLKGLKKEKF